MSTASDTTWSYELRALECGEALERYTRWILEPVWPHLRGRVIEVGAGIGSIAEQYLPHVDEAVLVEPAGNLREVLSRKVAQFDNARIFSGFLSDIIASEDSVQTNTFDTALMVNVLEHVEDDVAVLRELHDLLKPGGKLFVFVPAMPVLYGSVDERVGHLRRYTRDTLQRVIEAGGFRIDRSEYFDWLGALPWFVSGRMLRQSIVSPASLRAYDRFAIPVCRMVDEILNPQRFGKNLRLTATKA